MVLRFELFPMACMTRIVCPIAPYQGIGGTGQNQCSQWTFVLQSFEHGVKVRNCPSPWHCTLRCRSLQHAWTRPANFIGIAYGHHALRQIQRGGFAETSGALLGMVCSRRFSEKPFGSITRNHARNPARTPGIFIERTRTSAPKISSVCLMRRHHSGRWTKSTRTHRRHTGRRISRRILRFVSP